MFSIHKVAATFVVFMACATVSRTANAAEDLVDQVIDQFFSELARKQGFTRLSYLQDENAKIGSIYWVSNTDVRCADDLRKMQSQARPLSVNYWQDLPDSIARQGGAVKSWTSVRLESFLGSQAQAALNAKLPGRQGDLSAVIGYLKKTNAQVTYGVLERPSFPLRQSAKEMMNSAGVKVAGDMAGDASGALIPFAQILVQSFKYDESLARSGDVSIGVKFMNLFGARIAGELSSNRVGGFQLPTNAVLAFKADRLLVPETCP